MTMDQPEALGGQYLVAIFVKVEERLALNWTSEGNRWF